MKAAERCGANVVYLAEVLGSRDVRVEVAVAAEWRAAAIVSEAHAGNAAERSGLAGPA